MLEILCQTQNLEELDIRTRINLQEALIRFVKDERKWASLPFGEQTRLLQKLTTRASQFSPFAENISVQSIDEKGNLITRQAQLLLDTTRNKNLSEIFDKIVNQQIALAFYEQFGVGLIEHLERLISLETKFIGVDKENPESHLLPITYVDIQNNFLPLSVDDLELIRCNGIGIMVQLIPRFMRLPLNKLYFAISQRSCDTPSLALQFYLETYFSSRSINRGDSTSEEHIRTLFAKSFYTVIRRGGFSFDDIKQPEASREERFTFFTLNDEDSTPLDLGEEQQDKLDQLRVGSSLRAVKAELERLRSHEKVLKQRREVHGPAVKIELTLDQIVKDIIRIQRDQIGSNAQDETDFLALTAWIPSPGFDQWSEWERESLIQHGQQITSPDFLAYLPVREQQIIRQWQVIATTEFQNEKTQAQIDALEQGTDLDSFVQELGLRFYERHYQIVQQHREAILEQLTKQITRMFRIGSITAEMVVRDRYDAFAQYVLPYIYYYCITTSQGEEVWVPSPYPFSKFLFLIHTLELMLNTGQTINSDAISLSLCRDLLEQLYLKERLQWSQPDPPLPQDEALLA